ncbi:TIR-like protein FxsC [Streptomyces sp. SAS_267]|uniref:TIR-like protein FxsC n=1 Tax=unclassified Streptomyces TaxID=2593676 RepID=UPI0036FC69BA
MPERRPGGPDPLARVVAALHAAAPDLDGPALADLLWLASRLGGGAADGSSPVADTRPAAEPGTPQSTSEVPESGAAPVLERAAEWALHERLRGARGRVRGEAVAASGASGLPMTLPVTRALRPWKRPWQRGRADALDMDATVDAYARSGELIPRFRPAPERWFGLILVVDRSPAMQVWQEVVDDFTAVLNRLGAFQTLQVCDLVFGETGPELRDGLGRTVGPGRLRSPDGRRLVLAVSDCADPGWREPRIWRQLRAWGMSSPVALLNPLPVKLWRRTGLDLPGTRVLPGPPGADSTRLVFEPPPLLPGGDRAGWLPVPVLSLSPHSVGRWSRTVMRRSTEGCGAVLVPRDGRPAEERLAPRAASGSADRFLRTASPAAARLAVLSSPFDELSIRLLHLIRQELVPEAEVADVSELLTSGLFPVRTDRGGTVELLVPRAAQERLRKELTENEVWRINRALSRHMASHQGWSGPLPAVVHDPRGPVELPAGLRSFAEASRRTLELLGLPEGSAPRARADVQETEPARRPPPPARSTTSRTTARTPYFFLSYAHTPAWGQGTADPDHWVSMFYRDLCAHIRQMASLPADADVGFMDREMNAGEDWPDRLSENLAHCQVFVPLFSPRYFASEICGRELYTFSARVLEARAAGGIGTESRVVPVLWTGVDHEQLPESVHHLHVGHEALGERYADNGIYGLIKLNRMRPDYEKAVLGLARRIVRTADEAPLPPGRPRSLASTPSAFKPRGSGPRSIRLTVAAPTRHDVAPHRDPAPYGASALDWNPYHEESTRPIASVAEELLRALDYRVTVSSFDDEEQEDEQERESDAGRGSPGPLGILVIDCWSLTDDERRGRLRAFDARARPWQAAIVPWAHTDPQSLGEEGRDLVRDLERTLPLTIERGRRTDTRTAVNGVPTLQAFTYVLPSVVAMVTQQYLRYAEAHPPSSPPPPRPRLMGPTALRYPSPDGWADREDDA